ncbi:hypothetical protein FO519_002036 [Halicephalobus sp. NKZ332]|nr:hypothetical protein FO519_002036 [Halicephalobus sp. NKZ332]
MGRLFVENFGGKTVYECRQCCVYLTNQKEMISPHFRGSTGPAILFTRVANIKHGDLQQRNMMTGKHYVRDVHCKYCDAKLGWMYEFAVDFEQRYKEGKVILEKSFINEVSIEHDRIPSPPASLSSGSMSGVSSITITFSTMTVLSAGKKTKKEKSAITVHNHESQQKPSSTRVKENKEKLVRNELKTKKVAGSHTYDADSVLPSSSKASTPPLVKNSRKTIGRPASEKKQSQPSENTTNEGYNSDDEHVPGFLDPNLEASFAHGLRTVRSFEISHVEGDGACMFRAVALQIYGDQEKHMDVRVQTIEFLIRNRDHFSQFIAEDFNEYIERKRTVTTHGNHVELQAITELYGRPVEIYEYDTKPSITFHPITVDANLPGDLRPIRLSYHGATHYNAIYDPRLPIRIPNVSVNTCSNMHERIDVANAVRESEANHIEEQMLNDKIKMTDYEGTDKDLTAHVARQSFLDYVRSLEAKSAVNSEHKQEKPSTTFSTISSSPSNSASSSKSFRPSTTPTKRAASSPHLYSPFRKGDSLGSKMRRNDDTSASLPNIGKEFGFSFYRNHSNLMLNNDPLFDPDKPTSTKALFATPTKQEKNKDSNDASSSKIKSTEFVDFNIGNPNQLSVDADSPWYHDLLISSAYDEDDGLARALALSEEEFYKSQTNA